MKIKQRPEDFFVEENPLFEFDKKGKYTYFLLEKRNYNTEKAIRKIASITKIPRKRFGYAGNKDKKAITKQYVSVRGKIREINLEDIKTTIVGYGNKPISLGDLNGNSFKIIIREIDTKPDKTDFFVNYFGEQRFGYNNLEVGTLILKGDFEKAAEKIHYNVVKEHLKELPNDYVGALKKVPFKILRLYINSVQSWLWNEAAVEYVQKKSEKIKQVEYSNGRFVFSQKNIDNIKLPLISFDTEFDGNLYEKPMRKLGIKKRNFVIRSMPGLTPLGGERDLISNVRNLKIGRLEKNELGPKKKIQIEFTLGKGSYATVFLKKII